MDNATFIKALMKDPISYLVNPQAFDMISYTASANFLCLEDVEHFGELTKAILLYTNRYKSSEFKELFDVIKSILLKLKTKAMIQSLAFDEDLRRRLQSGWDISSLEDTENRFILTLSKK